MTGETDTDGGLECYYCGSTITRDDQFEQFTDAVCPYCGAGK